MWLASLNDAPPLNTSLARWGRGPLGLISAVGSDGDRPHAVGGRGAAARLRPVSPRPRTSVLLREALCTSGPEREWQSTTLSLWEVAAIREDGCITGPRSVSNRQVSPRRTSIFYGQKPGPRGNTGGTSPCMVSLVRVANTTEVVSSPSFGFRGSLTICTSRTELLAATRGSALSGAAIDAGVTRLCLRDVLPEFCCVSGSRFFNCDSGFQGSHEFHCALGGKCHGSVIGGCLWGVVEWVSKVCTTDSNLYRFSNTPLRGISRSSGPFYRWRGLGSNAFAQQCSCAYREVTSCVSSHSGVSRPGC